MRTIGMWLILLAWSSAHAAPGLRPDKKEFWDHCYRNRQTEALPVPRPEVGEITYFPVQSLEPSQSRFSYQRLLVSLNKVFATEPMPTLDKNRDRWTFSFDRGRSAYPIYRKLYGVFYRGKIHIVDGHHRALISLYLGAKTIPVEILADWSHLEPARFQEEMTLRNMSYERDFRGRPDPVRGLCEMEDDPNLQLARLLIHRVNVKFQLGQMIIEDTRGSELPIILKINQDIPFLEFEIADALRRAGVVFDPERGHELSKKELKKHLKIIKAAAALPQSRLSQVLLLDKPTPVAELKLKRIVLNHLARVGCERHLTTKGAPSS